ncbi:hypothetical protein, partial [Dyella silvatica]|uniref:hypothetical protein n=1 Tax=Dyella silvatica TaxID=2992128 RepID=UPI002252F445
MSDSSMQPAPSADSSSVFEGFTAALGISVALIVLDGAVLAGGLLAWSAPFWPIFFLLSPLLLFAFVGKLLWLARRGRQRAFNGFAITMLLIWLPLISLFAWLLYDIQTHGFAT